MAKLSPAADSESVIELCMIAGTHVLNAAAHVAGAAETDVVHSDLVAIDREGHRAIPADWSAVAPASPLLTVIKSLAVIEGLRPRLVRGGETDPGGGTTALEAYAAAKRAYAEIAAATQDRTPSRS